MKALSLTIFSFLSAFTFAQDLPRVSQGSEVEQTVGFTEIEVSYFRPNVKGREIFGDLVPYGEVWRTGANQATVIEFEHDVKVNGEDIEAGKYALFTIPNESEWTIILNSDHKQWGAYNYDKEKDILKTKVKVNKTEESTETMSISFENVMGNATDIRIRWDKVQVDIPVEVSVDDKIDGVIKEALADTSNKKEEVYSNVAGYYLKREDWNQAESYADLAINEDTEYWLAWWYKARANAGNEDFKSAVKYGKKALKSGKAADEEFQYADRLNEVIEEWKEK